MAKRQGMMELVWLLNAACLSSHEAAGLLKDLDNRQEELVAVAQETAGNPEMREFFSKEMERSLMILVQLQGELEGVLQGLRSAQACLGGDAP